MNYDIYHSSITYFPLLPLSKTVSFERKVLDIRQMPAQVLFPHWDDEFEFIYVLSGMMEFRVRQKAFLVSSGEGFFLNTGEIHSACAYQSYDCRFVIYRICPSVLFQTEDNPLYQKYIKPMVDHPSFGFLTFVPKVPWQKSVNVLLMVMS